MNMQKMYNFVVECMKTFNYPLISVSDDAQIAEFFDVKNRMFLAAWILGKIDPKMCYLSENLNEDALVEILGAIFCSNDKEAREFLNCSCEHETQFKILYRLSKHLCDVAQVADCNYEPISIETYDYYANLDLNVFPQYGPMKTLSCEERRQKIDAYTKEIEEFRRNEGAGCAAGLGGFDGRLVDELERYLGGLHRTVSEFLGQSLPLVNKEAVILPENFAKVVQNCNLETKAVAEYLTAVDTLRGVDEGAPVRVGDVDTKMLKEIAALCSEIKNL